MTIPTLVKNHQRQVYVTQLQKVVNEMEKRYDIFAEKEFKNIAQTLLALINKQKWAEALPYNEAQEIIKDINKDREFLVNNTKDLILVG